MDYVILVRDKRLYASVQCPIYQGEHNADIFKIIIPDEYTGTIPTLQIILPNQTGKIKQCSLSEDLYKESYRTIEIPITDVLTEYSGKLQLWFTFFPVDGEEKVIKTDYLFVDVTPHKGFSGIGGEFESTEDVIQKVTQLEVSVNSLKDSKADNLLLDEESNTLRLMSGDKELSSIELPDDVTWEIMN